MRIRTLKKNQLVSFIILIFGCVEPPDYDDGLLLNIPAIINEADYFSLSLKKISQKLINIFYINHGK